MGCTTSRSNAAPLILPGARRSDDSAKSSKLPCDHDAVSASVGQNGYFDVSVTEQVCRRFPWLVSLMLVQSISGFVVERFDKLIQRHVILAAFLTMLVGGGGNSSGQTVATLVRALANGSMRPTHFCRVLGREMLIGVLVAVGLAACAYPRVLLLSNRATHADAITIALSYAAIVIMANLVAVVTVFILHQCDMAAVGSPPVVQVIVDVVGIIITMLFATAILGDKNDQPEL